MDTQWIVTINLFPIFVSFSIILIIAVIIAEVYTIKDDIERNKRIEEQRKNLICCRAKTTGEIIYINKDMTDWLFSEENKVWEIIEPPKKKWWSFLKER